MMHTSQSMAQVLSALHFHPRSYSWAHLLDSTLSTFYFFLFLLSVTVFLLHLELFPELLHTKCMANNLRCSAAEKSEDTLNVFHSPTPNVPNFSKRAQLLIFEDGEERDVLISTGCLRK